jgi:hypothetical protein
MADRDEIQALAAGTPPAPARVVTLDLACEPEGLDAPAAELAAARDAGCRATLRLTGLQSVPVAPPLQRRERWRTPWRRCEPRRSGPEGLAAARLESLGEALGREGFKLAPEALAASAAVAHPEELALGAVGACGGDPPVFLLMPASALEAVQRGRSLALAGEPDADARRWWCGLLALAASSTSVSLVPEIPGPGLSSLASDQRWLGPSPGLGELIPAAPRRLRLDLDFRALLMACHDRTVGLAALAGRIVTAGDELLGRSAGGEAPRRLALYIDGIAQAVLASGRDPRAFGTLNWLTSRLRAFRDGARAASVRLARTRGAGGGLQPFPLPGRLEVAEAGALDRALLAHGARHSHLLCLSPWSIAPLEMGRDCLGLLPALASADSIAWRRQQGEWPAAIYGEALRFAWAVAQRS